MSPSVAAVVYFACGFPVAMYLVTQRRPTLVKLAVWSVFWPIFALVLLFRLVWPSRQMHENARRLRIERIAAEIERTALEKESMAVVFEFREIFYRYAGLAEAAAEPANDIADLHERCLARNNRHKLASHAAAARDEFIDMIAELAKSGSDSAAVHAIDLTELVRDADANERLRTLTVRTAEAPDAEQPRKVRYV